MPKTYLIELVPERQIKLNKMAIKYIGGNFSRFESFQLEFVRVRFIWARLKVFFPFLGIVPKQNIII